MKKILIAVIVVAIAATLINDVGRYSRTRYDLGVVAMSTADTVALSGKAANRDTNATAAAAYAASKGAVVYLFDQDDRRVHVWVEMPVPGTWIWGRVTAWQSGEPQDAPFMVQTDRTSNWK